MPADRLQRRPPDLGSLNQWVTITDKKISDSVKVSEQFFINSQKITCAASIVKPQPISNFAYENKDPAMISDVGVWIRQQGDYMPEIGHLIYHPYRYNGKKIDYVYRINKIGQEFFHQNLLYLICRTDIINDIRLGELNKPQISYVPFQ